MAIRSGVIWSCSTALTSAPASSSSRAESTWPSRAANAVRRHTIGFNDAGVIHHDLASGRDRVSGRPASYYP
jgi:hypothetical protein